MREAMFVLITVIEALPFDPLTARWGIDD
jgi:hypothetical protein